jgi:hypothetical protein
MSQALNQLSKRRNKPMETLIRTWNLESASSYLLRHCNSYNRFPTLLDMEVGIVDDEGNPSFSTWLKVLGENWSICDNIGMLTAELEETLSLNGRLNTPCPEMMDEEEQAAYDALPDSVVIYRGCYAVNKWGFSWSLSREVAAKFPFLGRYYRRDEQALLVKARVRKANIMAVCLGRGEQEIVTYNPKHISTSHLKAPDTFDKALCAAHATHNPTEK